MNDGAVPDEFHSLLAQYWDDVLAMLDEDEAHRLINLVQDIEGTDPNETLVELEDLLIDSLPGDHPLVTYLADRLKFQAPTAEGHRLSLLDMHRWLRAQVIPPPERSGRDLFTEVRRRLLGVPSYDADLVAGIGDEDRQVLIRLRADDGTVRVPRFQFRSDPTRPWPVVLETNRLLDADIDPWGAASWWVDPHALIDMAPIDLLGGDRERWLPALARRLGED